MKKILPVLTVILIAAALICVTVFAGGVLDIGDADGDGKVTFEDYILTRLAADGLEELDKEHFSAADIDGNGVIDEKDYKAIFNYVTNETPLVKTSEGLKFDPTVTEPAMFRESEAVPTRTLLFRPSALTEIR